MTIFDKLKASLQKTKKIIINAFLSDDLERLEEALLLADVGVKGTNYLLEKIRKAGGDKMKILQEEMRKILTVTSKKSMEEIRIKPEVILVVGVNGSGKTTTVGKLAFYYKKQNKEVIIASADTYRDAATEQLKVWAERAGVEIVLSQKGQDAGAVVYDTIVSAEKRNMDVVLVDTAGRLHTRKDLMEEVKKIKRVANKIKPDAPNEIFLTLDATVGQNGIEQAKIFKQELGLTGIIVTKLDGTAKGGILIPIVIELGIPVRFVGFGEGVEDFAVFSPPDYVKAIFED